MAKLLVLSLAETTSSPDGYAIIARDIETEAWVIIPSLPKRHMFIDGKEQWDMFAVTEADLTLRFDKRSGVFDVAVINYLPKMIVPPVKDNQKRIRLLEMLAVNSKDELVESPDWVGILRNPNINNLYFEKRFMDRDTYDETRTFFWESRVSFSDYIGKSWRFASAPGVACKDMRFKAYWKDLMLSRREEFELSKLKWLNYLRMNSTYLLIEFLPNEFHGTIPMVSGVICINDEEGTKNEIFT